MSESGDALLQVEDVAKSFGGVQALRRGSFTLSRGEIVAIVGANGAGKSTLIKIVAGVYRPDSGRLLVRGEPVAPRDHTVSHMRQLGIEVVYQDLAIVPNMSAPYNLFLGRIPRRLGIFMDENAMHVKTRAILDDLKVKTVQSLRQPISELSGGQQQSVAIGRAIAWGSEIVILDEPTAALGPTETGEVERLMHEIRNRGTAVILISHNLEQVLRLADRIVVVHHGLTSRAWPKNAVTDEQLVRAITLGEQVA